MSKQKEQLRHTQRQMVFSNAEGGKEFFAANGLVIRNLNELSQAFESIDDYTFQQHVNAEKNDFAQWVGDVIGHQDLAEQLRASKSRQEHQILALKEIVSLLK